MEIVGKVTETREFRQAVMNTVGDRISLDACEADLKRTRKELHSQEHLKYKLGTELDNLDVLSEAGKNLPVSSVCMFHISYCS